MNDDLEQIEAALDGERTLLSSAMPLALKENEGLFRWKALDGIDGVVAVDPEEARDARVGLVRDLMQVKQNLHLLEDQVDAVIHRLSSADDFGWANRADSNTGDEVDRRRA